MTERGASSEVGGADALDLELAGPARAAPHGRLALLRTRAALGLEPALAPAIVFVPLGLLLGPRALGILPEEALAHLDTAVSVGLAALGVFVGLAVDLRGHRDRRMLAAGSVEALVTVATVVVAVLLLLHRWRLPLDAAPTVVALTLGLCASASSAVPVDGRPGAAREAAVRIADLDDVLPILLGGLVVASAAARSMPQALLATVETIGLGLAVAVAGWLLFERAHGPAERGIFVVGTLALLGGTAAYLSLSPLLAGMAAGFFWSAAPGRCDQIIRDDLRKLQHPLVVLLLLTAGASLSWSLAALWLFAPYVLFRLAGKLVGGWAASRVVSEVAPSDLGAHLISPGVLGIAFALAFQQVSGSAAGAAVLAAASAGSLASEVLGMVAMPRPERT
jgi:hypothetical protein